MNLSLTTFNRLGYLTQSVSSLMNTSFTVPTTLRIFDDHSEDPMVLELFKSIPKIQNLEMEFYTNTRNLGCDLNVNQAIKKSFEFCDDKFVVVLDSDGLYNPNWLSFLNRKINELQDEKIAAISIFDTPSHEVIDKYDEDLNEKRNVGGFAVAINRDVYDKVDPNVILEGHDTFCWDWQFIKRSEEMNYKRLCSKKSYAQHIGAYGVHSNGSKFDFANNFTYEGDI
jgi:glycosyltransferase involved in cell wall biosynthesis